MDNRLHTLTKWLQKSLDDRTLNLQPMVGDASFRRYFRLNAQGQSYVAMDAPPELEDARPFVTVARSFAPLGVRVPTIHAADFEQGFLLLEDFGEKLYLHELSTQNVDELYSRALTSLVQIHQCQQIENYNLPSFDANFIRQELDNWQHWFLHQYLGVDIPQEVLSEAFDALINSAIEQPQVCVHRDYHSRNLMVLQEKKVGILDFQDAVWGPITYDAVSLLRDCYISWPREKVKEWALNFYQRCVEAKLLVGCDDAQFLRWFDLMGIQRHLKALFIFTRKFLRDGVDSYLIEMPRTLTYIIDISTRYGELAELHQYLRGVVGPRLSQRMRHQ